MSRTLAAWYGSVSGRRLNGGRRGAVVQLRHRRKNTTSPLRVPLATPCEAARQDGQQFAQPSPAPVSARAGPMIEVVDLVCVALHLHRIRKPLAPFGARTADRRPARPWYSKPHGPGCARVAVRRAVTSDDRSTSRGRIHGINDQAALRLLVHHHLARRQLISHCATHRLAEAM